MTRRRRGAPQGVANYWPGYVDALTNVVLNLLFLIAMFGIALAVMNSAPRSAGPKRAGPASQARDMGRGELDAASSAGPSGPVEAAVAAPPGPLDSLRERAAVPTARAPDDNPAGTEQDQPGDDALASPLRRIGAHAPASGDPLATVPAGQLNFIVADAYQRRVTPGVRVVRQADPTGGMLVTVSLAVGTEPVAALQQAGIRPLLQAGLAGAGTPAGSRLRLWTATRLADPVLRRAAYLALIEARNQLLALGYPAAAIETRLIEGSTIGRDGKQIYIHAEPAPSH